MPSKCDCGKNASFGLPGETSIKWCATCPNKPGNAINKKKMKKCECGKHRPSFNLKGETGGKSFTQSVFDHWEIMSGDPLDSESKLQEIIKETRLNKNLSESIPDVSEFLDKL